MKIILTLIFVFAIGSSFVYSQVWERSLNGRSVWSLATDPQGNIYAGGLTSSNSRIWRSTNNGNSWDTLYVGAGQSMWDFGFDSMGNVYVANYSTGMLKSTNNGANFTLIPSSIFSNKNLQGVECSGNFVYVTSSSGFFRSTDNGATFIETALTGLICLPLLVDKDSANIIYVGVSGGSNFGFYRSTDYGLTFSSNLNPGKNGYSIFQKDNGDIIMATTTSPYNFDISTNRGLSWTTVSNVSGAVRGVTVSDQNNIYTSGNGGVFRSTNGGINFSNQNFTLTSSPVLYENYFNVPTIMAGASGAANGGVWRYIEGTSSLVPRINLMVILEGLYDAGSDRMARRDTIKMYLANSTSPYAVVDSAMGVLDSLDFSTLSYFPNATSGTYYIVVKHINTIETWSKSGGESITNGVTYDYSFTNSDAQAFGNNEKQVDNSPVNYAIFSGDVNQDDAIDLTDIANIFNDASIFQGGYIATDVNGDYFVDLSDVTIAFNNSAAFVSVIRP